MLPPSSPDSAPLAASPPRASHQPTFWALQIGGWLAFILALMAPWLGVVPVRSMLVTKVPLAVAGLGTTLILRSLYRRQLLVERSSARLIAAVILASAIGGWIWINAAATLVHWIDPSANERAALIRATLDRIDGTVYYVVVLLTWSLIYLGIAHHRAWQAERERALAGEALAQRARLAALRYQVNPHFLFNTLNAISTLVVEQRTSDASRMISRLSDFLRLTLDGPDAEEIPVDAEIDLVSRYLEIEKVRFGDRLEVHIEVDRAVRSTTVPSMILQPIVENAVCHGVARCEGKRRIGVCARRRDGVLELSVVDDGPGLPHAAERATGLGLGITRDRLRHAYGGAARLDLFNEGTGGARIVLHIPLQPSAENESAPAGRRLGRLVAAG